MTHHIRPTDHFGPLRVLHTTEQLADGDSLCQVEFVETGTRRVTRRSSVRHGRVKDLYAKTLHGVACIGNPLGIKGYDPTRHDALWRRMIARCYDPTNTGYKHAGALSVEVCKRWLCLERFCKDMRLAEHGIDVPLYPVRVDFSLDYAPQHCLYSPHPERPGKSAWFIASHKDGRVIRAHAQRAFAREHGLGVGVVHSCLHGRQGSTKGWSFEFDPEHRPF